MCAGYYSYRQGYTPEFEGIERFKGTIVHPQQWPEDLDYAGKRVVVIGSGATAMTLVPAMAEDVAHIVMLQRSPTYVVSRPDKDVIANALRKVLPDTLGLCDHALEERRRCSSSSIAARARIPRRSRRSCSTWCARSSGRTTTSRPTSRPATTRGISASAWCRTAICSKRSAPARRRSSPTTIERFTETGIALASGKHARRRHHRHRDRPQPRRARRDAVRRRRRARRFRPDLDLQGHDVLRRAEPGLHVRLHQRLVDAARRPHRPSTSAGCSTTWTRPARAR